ncbi:hypothetical protein D3C81_1678080 [compost metagenome]
MIKDRILDPCRRGEDITAVDVREFEEAVWIRRAFGLEVAFRHPDPFVALLQQEAVFEPAVEGNGFTLPIIEHRIAGKKLHRDQLFSSVPCIFVAGPGKYFC